MSQPPYSGPPYPGQPYSGPPNPDVPTSVPPQPGFPPPPQQQPQYGAQPGYPTSGQPGYATPGQSGYSAPGQPGYAPGQPGYAPAGPPGPPPTADYSMPGYPTSGQPGYAAPEQSGYPPAPEYGAPTYAMAGPPVPPPRKSKALPIVLISLAVVLVLCVGGAAVVFMAARDTADDIVKAAESAAATPPPTNAPLEPADPVPTETAPGKTISIVEPKTLGGRPKLTDPQFASAAEQLQAGLDDVPGATNTVGALYGTPEKRDIVIIAGVEAPVDDPARELNGTFLGAGVGGLKVTGITSVDPGPLGGVAKCGKTSTSGIDMVMCGWADDGSVGWIIWYFKSVSKAKAEFPKLRAQIEKSS